MMVTLLRLGLEKRHQIHWKCEDTDDRIVVADVGDFNSLKKVCIGPTGALFVSL